MSKPGPVTAEELELLRSFDTPTVCNVIELFEVRPNTAGYMDARIQCCFPQLPVVVGYAATVTGRSAAAPRGRDAYRGLTDYLRSFAEVPSPPVAVMQDLDNPPRAAGFGEIMCSFYKAFGAKGLITSGAGRDLDQVEAIEFPVFTSGTICSHGYPQLIDFNVPVDVGGLTVEAGDLIHADRNGVTTIPLEIAGEVARYCQAFVDTEALELEYVKNMTDKTVEGLEAVRAEAVKRRSELRQKVSRKSLRQT